MSRQKDPFIEQRNRELIADFERDNKQSDATLGRKHGMGLQLVGKVLAAHGLRSRQNTRRRTLQADQRPISNFHKILGNRVQLYLAGAAVASDRKLKPETRVYARELKMSVQHLNGIFLGVSDLTLTEAISISAWIRKPLSELMSEVEREEKIYDVRGS